MPSRALSSLLLVSFSRMPVGCPKPPSNSKRFSPPTRTLRLTDNFTRKDILSGARRVRVWIPLPPDRRDAGCVRRHLGRQCSNSLIRDRQDGCMIAAVLALERSDFTCMHKENDICQTRTCRAGG